MQEADIYVYLTLLTLVIKPAQRKLHTCKRLSPPMRKVSFQVVKGKLSAAKR